MPNIKQYFIIEYKWHFIIKYWPILNKERKVK